MSSIEASLVKDVELQEAVVASEQKKLELLKVRLSLVRSGHHGGATDSDAWKSVVAKFSTSDHPIEPNILNDIKCHLSSCASNDLAAHLLSKSNIKNVNAYIRSSLKRHRAELQSQPSTPGVPRKSARDSLKRETRSKGSDSEDKSSVEPSLERDARSKGPDGGDKSSVEPSSSVGNDKSKSRGPIGAPPADGGTIADADGSLADRESNLRHKLLPHVRKFAVKEEPKEH